MDREYREQADAGKLPRIAPRRFNPSRAAWLPVLHTRRGQRAYTALFSNTARAHRAGVKFAMGSDAVFTMFGQNTRELRWFVDAGMTPAQALATATTNAAALLGMEKSLGAIAPGYYADIVGVYGNPLADIGVVINGVTWVMKGGKVVVR